MAVTRRVWGFRLLRGEMTTMPRCVQMRFAQLWHELAIHDVAPDDVWRCQGRQLWIYETRAEGRAYRMAVEPMPEGWVMVWAHGPAAVMRRRLRRRLARLA